jgi:hypothetical protein
MPGETDENKIKRHAVVFWIMILCSLERECYISEKYNPPTWGTQRMEAVWHSDMFIRPGRP